MLLKAIENDIKAAREAVGAARKANDAETKARENARLTLLTTVYAAIEKKGKDDGDREPTEKEGLTVLGQFVNGINESLGYLSARADDAAMNEVAKLTGERAILEPYLTTFAPKLASEAEIESAAKDIIAGLNDKSMKSMGAVMNALKAKFGESLDGTVASAIAKRELAPAAKEKPAKAG